jgi:hypothetical protein
MSRLVNVATEAQEAVAFVQWSRLQHICNRFLLAIPNGGSRHPVEAKNLVAQGVRKGVSDYFLAYPVPPYCGMWIELKRSRIAKPNVSREQQDWLDLMNAHNFRAVVAYGATEAIILIEDYLNGEKIKLP